MSENYRNYDDEELEDLCYRLRLKLSETRDGSFAYDSLQEEIWEVEEEIQRRNYGGCDEDDDNLDYEDWEGAAERAIENEKKREEFKEKWREAENFCSIAEPFFGLVEELQKRQEDHPANILLGAKHFGFAEDERKAYVEGYRAAIADVLERLNALKQSFFKVGDDLPLDEYVAAKINMEENTWL